MFTFFEILKTNTFHIHRMPVQLASPIVGIAMEEWDDS